MVWSHSQHEEHVWRCAGRAIRMAEDHPHWRGIQESIIDLCATVPVHFVIADSIVAMEGPGPLNGAARTLETIVLAGDPVAADATCARLTGFEPDRIAHICEGSRFLGNSSPNHWLRPKSRPLAATMTLHVPAWGQSQHSRLLAQVDWFRLADNAEAIRKGCPVAEN